MPEFGVFSESAGGCIFAPCYSRDEAEQSRAWIILQDGEDPADLDVLELCPEHEEQPKDGCEGCADDEEEEA